jgi:hypothetical protein
MNNFTGCQDCQMALGVFSLLNLSRIDATDSLQVLLNAHKANELKIEQNRHPAPRFDWFLSYFSQNFVPRLE